MLSEVTPNMSGVVGVSSAATDGDVPSPTARRQLALRTRQRRAYPGAAAYPPMTAAEADSMAGILCCPAVLICWLCAIVHRVPGNSCTLDWTGVGVPTSFCAPWRWRRSERQCTAEHHTHVLAAPGWS